MGDDATNAVDMNAAVAANPAIVRLRSLMFFIEIPSSSFTRVPTLGADDSCQYRGTPAIRLDTDNFIVHQGKYGCGGVGAS